jgi:hypothetical protein
MPHTTILFVHLQYDAPDSPQSRALRALAASVVRTTAPPLYLVGGYAYDDFDTDSLPLAVARAVRTEHQARTDTAMAEQLQAHVARAGGCTDDRHAPPAGRGTPDRAGTGGTHTRRCASSGGDAAELPRLCDRPGRKL